MVVLLLQASTALPFDVLTWSLFAFIVACGGAFAGSVVLAWQHATQAAEILPRVFGVLAVLSSLVLGPHYSEVRTAKQFMTTADSARGVVTRTYVRGGLHLTVAFTVHSVGHTVVHNARSQEAALREGDSVWVYFQSGNPEQALVGHPGPDLETTRTRLAFLWLFGGILLLGYGGPLLMKPEHRRRTEQVAWPRPGEGAV